MTFLGSDRFFDVEPFFDENDRAGKPVHAKGALVGGIRVLVPAAMAVIVGHAISLFNGEVATLTERVWAPGRIHIEVGGAQPPPLRWEAEAEARGPMRAWNDASEEASFAAALLLLERSGADVSAILDQAAAAVADATPGSSDWNPDAAWDEDEV